MVAEAIEEGVKTKKKGGCTARTGCFICQQAEDKSLAQMVEFEPERFDSVIELQRLIAGSRTSSSRGRSGKAEPVHQEHAL